MKKMLQGLTVSALVLAGLVVSASAQSSVNSTKVKVGFDFMVGNKQLPAGEYRIKILNNDNSGKLLRVESLDGKVAAIITGIQGSNRFGLQADQVKFNRYGDKYFLSGVRFGYEPNVHQIPRSRSERDAQRQSAKIASNQQKEVAIPTTGQ